MQGAEYQALAMRTNDCKATDRMLENMLTCDMKYLLQQNLIAEDEQHLDFGGIFNACLGLSGEVGELNDMLKKWIFHEKQLDAEHLKREISDVCWYLALMCDSFEFSLDEIMQINIDKLKARYPEGFDTYRANHRQAGDV
jgi:NTP pyrophosphatase (non-canonical NTP hydrolase)|nr:MAG TPA: NTP-PPase-like protein [Bacteriophage sp.]